MRALPQVPRLCAAVPGCRPRLLGPVTGLLGPFPDHPTPLLRRLWASTVILSPDERLRACVLAINPCEHAWLCGGLALTLLWEDYLVAHECSDDLGQLDQETFRLLF